jgi:hypothetical protein
VTYSLELARAHWEEGEHRVVADGDLERAVDLVIHEIRRRLGAFEISELANLYAAGTDWAEAIAAQAGAGAGTTWVVDAAFWRYARNASDFAGGRVQRAGEFGT